MKKERTEQEEIRVGKEASLILSEPAWVEAVKDAEESFLLEWRNGETVEAREMAHAKLIALDSVVRTLRTFHDRAVVIERTAQRAERAKGRSHNPAG